MTRRPIPSCRAAIPMALAMLVMAGTRIGLADSARTTTINEHSKNHWSYRPMAAVEPPKEPGEDKVHPIDAFLEAKRREAGLKANPPAPARALIRRAYHNLTGLPPAPEVMESLASNFDDQVWENLIETLLASPHYGEKWARHWLDVVRYADSNGFERDNLKPHIWRYRDYVIDSFNQDKPYDQFIREQLAGDELDTVTAETLIATGYHRLMQWDDEPSDPMQYRYDVLDDNVRTTSEAFLGMTLGCARCHDHKGDPIPQKDYYRFMAFFHGVTHMDNNRVVQAVGADVKPEDLEKQRRDRAEELSRLEQEITAWENEAKAKLSAKFPELREALEKDGGSAPVLFRDSREVGQEWSYTTAKPADDWHQVGFRPTGWKTGLAPFGKGQPGARAQWEGTDLWLQATFGLTSVPSRISLRIHHEQDVTVHLNGQMIFQARGRTNRYTYEPLDAQAARALQTGRNVIAVHTRGERSTGFFDLGLEAGHGGDEFPGLLRKHGADLYSKAELQRHERRRQRLVRLRQAPLPGETLAMVVQENGSRPGDLFVHRRGSAHAPGEQVSPGFPSIFQPSDPIIPIRETGKTSGRRRALAEWIASPENPRTARVMVNRLWQHHFGRGLCPTPNDFGFLGEGVTHPELLDWLAQEFIRSGWSVKHMHRLLMTSKAYRTSSAPNAMDSAKDPANRLFWRFDMRRLTAEELRDALLSVTGKLNPKVGGPGFYAALPTEVLATASTKEGKWGQSPPEEQNRRSVYMIVKRSLVPPEMADFDFADSDSSCAARFTTTVPTQALALLNGASMNVHAARLADRLEREASDLAAQVQRGLRLVTNRPATEEEVGRALRLVGEFRERHGLDPRQALERFCLMALNLNEFVYLD